jgi:hypothetical protein
MFSLESSKDQAKKLILDSPDYTKKAAIVLLIGLIVIFLHLILSFVGTENSWTCELDSTSGNYPSVCKKLVKIASCRSLTGPLKADVVLDVQSTAKASAEIICPWESAISELRICFDIGGFLVVLIGLAAIIKENRNLADLHINSAYFFGLLISIAAFFDFLAISDSKNNNYSLCNWTEEINLGNGVSREHLECSYILYEFTGYVGVLSSFMVFLSSYMISTWKKHLVLD